MDKNAIKKFAVWARRELIERVSQKAMQYGIEKDNIVDAAADSINGKVLTDTQKNQRRALISQINAKGYEEVMEEVAYTWFNRLIALRFMEVNGYLPTRVRVFTDEENNFRPQIIDEALHLDLDGLNMEKVYEFKNTNQTEELYKYLLITQCNALNSILPGMFQRISDYTELLLPDNLLREGSVIEQMISTIPEQDWQDAVQIIGWLYQYYNAEKKDEVFAALKKNVKITKENIPAATQLFTPDWIVRYMVENSLGRLWVEGHPNDELKSGWKYYLEEAKQEPEVQAQLAEICKEYAAMTPEQIKCIDPCCGSGHILAYLFDVLVQIYESYGYTTREAVESIVKNNLYGLDIDDRAAQLAYFAVMMKARQYDRRFFSRQIQPNVYAIQESNGIDRYALEYFCNGDTKLKAAMDTIVKEMHDAKEYGSILNITPVDFAALYARFDEVRDDISMSKESVLNSLLPLVQVAEALAQKYDVVVTNPPYMGGRSISSKLGDKIQELYPDGRQDLFAVFIERDFDFLKANGFSGMITMHSFMFLASFEHLRVNFLKNNLISLVHLGIKAFDEIGNDVVQTASYVVRKAELPRYDSVFSRLVDCKDQVLKQTEFLKHRFLSTNKVADFLRIPGATLAYWVPEAFIENYENYPALGSMIEMSSLNKTGDNETYLRYWWEIDKDCIGGRWIFYSKGGNFRRYYGNIDMVIDWSETARNFYKTNKTSNLVAEEYWYREGITYSAVTSRGTGFRYLPKGCVYDMGGPAIFLRDNSKLLPILALLNSSVSTFYFNVMNPSINLQTKDIKQLPVILDSTGNISRLAEQNRNLAEADWNSSETSYCFGSRHFCAESLASEYDYDKVSREKKAQMFMDNLREINLEFATLYRLDEESLPELESRDNAIAVYSKKEWVVSVISYAVGCMFGRYSPLKDGLLYAGGDWDYTAIQQELMDAIGKNAFSSGDMVWDANFIDKDNIIPICDDEYFEDDIVGRFINFISDVYGKDTLEENLKFIADALGGKGQPKEVIRNYFLNDFYADHCKIYQKRPIYWLFDSGKKNGFKALIYIHRYQPDTIARIRTDYVHEQQSRYRTAIADMENRIANASTSERVKLNKALTKLKDQDTELRSYEEKIHHLADQMIAIDLDDGVKVNYAKFQDVLAKIK
ncbi:BREX-1 system adenine-specific DNA-methyltransferase PglX [Negativibacillus massiliensis]|uniref:BREX-1 system adenine-specific DNA-methyltransferase PglX n=1 Tax=Negativibacillus massiliensis TaxID=1871035 RepID=UPI000975AE62|nr:BREX-1 system adenine-specific DNA-methyltransferase PglX [Negativibacillus massiliensis]